MEAPAISSALASLCLRHLLLLRGILIAVAITTFAGLYSRLAETMALAPLFTIVIALGLFTAVSWQRMRAGLWTSERAYLFQLLVDVIALTALFYFTGGSTNPFVSLYLLPVIIAAATLRTGLIWMVAASTAACYTALLMFRFAPEMDNLHGTHFDVHVRGMWLGFLLSAGLVAYFVARIASAFRDYDRALALAREEALRAHELGALGALAAGTAHDLGTPLATMAVLAKEIEYETQESEELDSKIKVLRSQILRCKDILSRMAMHAGHLRADQGHRQNLDRYLRELLAEWRNLRPEARISISWEGREPGPSIIVDRTLSQSIMSVLNNAADASLEHIEFHARWDDDKLQLEVVDQGAGVPAEVSRQLGRPFISTKPVGSGMGIGLYLARATLERLGGSLRLSNLPERGARAEITLPLGQITALRR
jgi:two-component system sensor histidine kinase RegB